MVSKTLKDMKRDALVQIGGLSEPSKMPGCGWNLPTDFCKTGSKLMQVPGSVCHACYARRGHYHFPSTRARMQDRLQKVQAVLAEMEARQHRDLGGLSQVFGRDFDPLAPAEEFMAQFAARIVERCNWQNIWVFRWFDSGDLQSWEMLLMILGIVKLSPRVRHWLPTREYSLVRKLRQEVDAGRIELPENLTLRVSYPMIGRKYADKFCGFPTSSVWAHLADMPEDTLPCTASIRRGQCGDCRACWDAEIQDVGYLRHD